MKILIVEFSKKKIHISRKKIMNHDSEQSSSISNAQNNFLNAHSNKKIYVSVSIEVFYESIYLNRLISEYKSYDVASCRNSNPRKYDGVYKNIQKTDMGNFQIVSR